MPIETVFRDREQKRLARIQYITDDAGRIIEASQYITSPAFPADLERTTQLDATALGRAITGEERNQAAVRVTFAYDSDGRVVERASYVGQQLSSRTAREFHEYGDGSKFSSSDEEPYFSEYEYDDRGNWTKKIVRHRSAVVAIHERQIAYCET